MRRERGRNRRIEWAGALLAGLALLAASGCRRPPPVTHAVRSTNAAACMTCHAGRAGARPACAHAGGRRGCADCHASAVRGLYPALMPHPGGDPAGCAVCHERGIAGAGPTLHLAEADCYSCHEAPRYGAWPPAVSHRVESPAEEMMCAICHDDVDHLERGSCLACHKS